MVFFPAEAVQVVLTATAQKKDVFHGAISELKDTYGFIEVEGGEREVFFHKSELQGGTAAWEDLRLCTWVSFKLAMRNKKMNAVQIARMDPEKRTLVEVLEEGTYIGRVICPRIGDRSYGGLILVERQPASATFGGKGTPSDADIRAAVAAAVAAEEEDPTAALESEEDGEVETNESASEENPKGSPTTVSTESPIGTSNSVPFGITSLLDPQHNLSVNERVEFRIAINVETKEARAVQVGHVARLAVAL